MVSSIMHSSKQWGRSYFDRARTGHLLRDSVVFLAGVEMVHTLSHVWWAISGSLPMQDPRLPSLTMTPDLNALAIVINTVITAGLFYWAHRLKT